MVTPTSVRSALSPATAAHMVTLRMPRAEMIKTGQLVVGRGIPVSGASSGAGAARNDPTIVSVVFFRFDLFSGVGLSVEYELSDVGCVSASASVLVFLFSCDFFEFANVDNPLF